MCPDGGSGDPGGSTYRVCGFFWRAGSPGLSQSKVKKSCARVDFSTAKRRSVPGRVSRRFRRVGFRAAGLPGRAKKKPGFFRFFPAAYAHV